VDGDVINVGDVTGLGDALMINAGDAARLDRGNFQGVLPWTPVWQPHRAIATAQPAFEASQSNPSGFAPLDFSIGNGAGDGLTVPIGTVSAGQVYNTWYDGNMAVDAGSGASGFRANLLSQDRPPVAAPDTVMTERADPDGLRIDASAPTDSLSPVANSVVEVGTVSGRDDSLLIDVGPGEHGREATFLETTVGQTSSAIAVSRSPSGSNPDRQSPPITPDLSPRNDHRIAVVPAPLNAEDPRVEGVPSEAVDAALDGWKPDAPT
jgi:hypothetical protein